MFQVKMPLAPAISIQLDLKIVPANTLLFILYKYICKK